MIVNRAIEYRIYPTKEQESLLAQTFGCVRLIYNQALEMEKGLYEAGMGFMSKFDLNNYCNRFMKADAPFLRDVDKFALTNSLYHLQSAFDGFFAKRTGYPKFKAKRDKQSYTTNFTNGNIAILKNDPKAKKGWIKLPKIGQVEAALHRDPETVWSMVKGSLHIKSATVRKSAAGRYFVSVLFAFDRDDVPQHPLPTKETTLGLDYSSPHFYVDSDGQAADMPHYFRESEARLNREQRKLSRMEVGSSNYQKQRTKVARLHETISNQRKDFCHQLSRKIANSYEAVCVEDLDLRNVSQSLQLGKSTMDNGFGMFRTFLRYKMEEQGKWYVVIDKWFPSTKTCHECGGYNPDVTLGMDTWICPHCGQLIQRDPNAGENIRDEGLRVLYDSLGSLASA